MTRRCYHCRHPRRWDCWSRWEKSSSKVSTSEYWQCKIGSGTRVGLGRMCIRRKILVFLVSSGTCSAFTICLNSRILFILIENRQVYWNSRSQATQPFVFVSFTDLFCRYCPFKSSYHIRTHCLIQLHIYQATAAKPISSSSSDSDPPGTCGTTPRGFKMGWITIVITAVYLMPHVTITISSAAIIEFPATSSLFIFATFSLSSLCCWIFCDQFLVFSSRVPIGFSRLSLYLGLNLLNIYVHISHLPLP